MSLFRKEARVPVLVLGAIVALSYYYGSRRSPVPAASDWRWSVLNAPARPVESLPELSTARAAELAPLTKRTFNFAEFPNWSGVPEVFVGDQVPSGFQLAPIEELRNQNEDVHVVTERHAHPRKGDEIRIQVRNAGRPVTLVIVVPFGNKTKWAVDKEPGAGLKEIVVVGHRIKSNEIAREVVSADAGAPIRGLSDAWLEPMGWFNPDSHESVRNSMAKRSTGLRMTTHSVALAGQSVVVPAYVSREQVTDLMAAHRHNVDAKTQKEIATGGTIHTFDGRTVLIGEADPNEVVVTRFQAQDKQLVFDPSKRLFHGILLSNSLVNRRVRTAPSFGTLDPATSKFTPVETMAPRDGFSRLTAVGYSDQRKLAYFSDKDVSRLIAIDPGTGVFNIYDSVPRGLLALVFARDGSGREKIFGFTDAEILVLDEELQAISRKPLVTPNGDAATFSLHGAGVVGKDLYFTGSQYTTGEHGLRDERTFHVDPESGVVKRVARRLVRVL